MDLIVTPKAGEDLDSLEKTGDVGRIAKKIDEIEGKIAQGFDPEKVVEKRTSGTWHPILQQTVGDYRIWFVEGEKTKKGDQDKVYLIRVLSKEKALKLQGVEVNPDIYL
jgi:mRNA-degrading endonuclease RelE of RelBE toxin-antitoxin system